MFLPRGELITYFMLSVVCCLLSIPRFPVSPTKINQTISQLYFRQPSNKTAIKELNTATLSDWATIKQTFCANRCPENRLKIQTTVKLNIETGRMKTMDL